MTAANASRTAMVKTPIARRSPIIAMSTANDQLTQAGPGCGQTRAMSCATVAPDSSTSSHTHTSFTATSMPSTRGRRPSTTSPRPRLSALESACSRVRVSGKRSRPTVPARKKNAPASTATTVNTSSAALIRGSAQGRGRLRALCGLGERHRHERREQRERERDVDGGVTLGAFREQQQGRDAAGAEQLHRHDPVGLAARRAGAASARSPSTGARRPRRQGGRSSSRRSRIENACDERFLLPQRFDHRRDVTSRQ